MSMDSSHGPHHHSRNHGSSATLRITEEASYEGSAATPATQPAITLPENTAHSPNAPVATPTYDYQAAPPSPGATKRSNEKQTSDVLCPVPKRARRDAPASDPSSVSACPSPTTPTRPESTCVEANRGTERNGGRRFGHSTKLYRSQSLPATLRRKRRSVDSIQQHLPPVTLNTLRELDLHEIYRNPKLRHDVVFDSQLHFRPNLDGSRGRRKREQADIYWKLVLHECEMLFANVRNRQSGAAQMAIKLPKLFLTMREILLTLVPKSDRGEVEAALDPPLLMQQLAHGVLDFKKLAQWLAGVLKAHCAPMRDQWVEQMVARISYGVDSGKISAFVDGLKIVFGILEAMKLDVANHQIRTLRPFLVSTAVQFEQGHFQERIDTGRLDMSEPLAWFQRAAAESPRGTDPYVVFTSATTETLMPSRYATFPATFTFDVERLEGIRDDIREATCLKVSILFFRQLTLSAKRDLDQGTIDTIRAQLLAILSEEEGPYRWIKGSKAIALHLAQAAHEYNGNTGLVDATTVKVAEGWLSKHLRLDSSIYVRIERLVVKDITTLVQQVMKSWSSLSTSPIMQAADLTGSSVELASISQRIAHIAFLHWRIFGKLYTAAV